MRHFLDFDLSAGRLERDLAKHRNLECRGRILPRNVLVHGCEKGYRYNVAVCLLPSTKQWSEMIPWNKAAACSAFVRWMSSPNAV
jgi:hypothetical protein